MPAFGAVVLKIDQLGQRLQRRGAVQGAVRPVLIVVGPSTRARSAADGSGSTRVYGLRARGGIPRSNVPRSRSCGASARCRPTPASTTRTPWACCWTNCTRREPQARSLPCWTATPPPTPALTTRDAWLTCWPCCSWRGPPARSSRWPAAPPPTPASTTRTPWACCWTRSAGGGH